MPMSVVPPAGHGTISVTGREGNGCACAAPASTMPISATTTAAADLELITVPLDLFCRLSCPPMFRISFRGHRNNGVFMAYWLLKTEPDVFGWNEQTKKGA